jgi:PTH1 family peptidyl-tRNA hydrolase
MKVIVGLGNPGVEYSNTPHSIGFEAVDAIASSIGASWEEKRAFSCLLARGNIGSEKVILVKPQTFMNLSGESVAPIVKYSNAKAEDLFVIQDDIDLLAGKIRVRKNGSCGGHNGIRNIIEKLGTQGFSRLKIGVGKDKSNVISHVLGKFSPEVREKMNLVLQICPEIVAFFIQNGVDATMNKYNSWSA